LVTVTRMSYVFKGVRRYADRRNLDVSRDSEIRDVCTMPLMDTVQVYARLVVVFTPEQSMVYADGVNSRAAFVRTVR